MTVSGYRKPFTHLTTILMLSLSLLLTACSSPSPDILHGYVEGEFLYIAAPLPGTVTLTVAKGGMVKKGEPLFVLESDSERNVRDEALRRLTQAQASLQDLRKGVRPTELAALNAQLEQAKSAAALAETEYGRQERLFRAAVVSAQSLDSAKSAREQQLQLVARLAADLKTAGLGARGDQIAAAQANVRVQESVLARTEWELAQKSRKAPAAAVVFDTLYRSGEWVAAGRPVVSLLPPENIKVRVFVPEGRIAALHPGDPLTVHVDGLKESFAARVSFISPRAEYTPPVIYSRESRAKLVYLVEAVFPPDVSPRLHPGQPVDVRFGR